MQSITHFTKQQHKIMSVIDGSHPQHPSSAAPATAASAGLSSPTKEEGI